MNPLILSVLTAQLLLASLTLDSLKAHAQSLPSYQEYAQNLAIEDGLNVEDFLGTINCESGWNPLAQGDDGRAKGLVQIRLDYWPQITEEQAEDPYYAIHFMADQWSMGNEHFWSCYSIVTGN